VILAVDQFAEIVIWQLPTAAAGSAHAFKYRLAFVASAKVRYDNEAGKGDHRHVGESQKAYKFIDLDRLVADFEQDIARWQDENRNS
jgi:hypothetical protein